MHSHQAEQTRLDARALESNRKKLLAMADKARASSIHYEGFHVGGAVLARHHCSSRYKIFPCHNTKFMAGEDPARMCAENHGITDAVRAGYTTVIAIAIVSPPKRDDLTGRDFAGTLPPCKYCRDSMVEQWIPNGWLSAETAWLAMAVDEDGERVVVGSTIGYILKKFPHSERFSLLRG